jgi:hypothetical protein
MLLNFQPVISVTLLVSGVASMAVQKQKRASLDTSLYVYGGTVDGAKVFYADGEYTSNFCAMF